LVYVYVVIPKLPMFVVNYHNMLQLK